MSFVCKQCLLGFTHKHLLFAHITRTKDCATNAENLNRLYINSQTSLLLEIRDRFQNTENKVLKTVYHTRTKYLSGSFQYLGPSQNSYRCTHHLSVN